MPHDRKQQPVKIGDVVIVPAVVTGVDKHSDFINVALETVESMFPAEHKTPLMLNCRQVQVISMPGSLDISDLAHPVPAEPQSEKIP